MLTVYFDRNVFADICELRNGLTIEEVKRIQGAVDSGSITIPTSITLLEETVRILQSSEEEYDQHIKTVFGLVNKRWMVKPPNELLIEDCASYAEQQPYQRLIPVPAAMSGFLDLTKNRNDLLLLAGKITQRFNQSAEDITGGLLGARAVGLERNVGRPDGFTDLWNGLAEGMIEDFLDRCSRIVRRLCKKRGLSKMLGIKSLRIYTIYYAWLLQSGWFGIQDKPRRVKPGDLADWFHAVQAAAADLFVTQESKTKPGKLPNILNQLHVSGFEVINLEEFLAKI
jgi:hypothetical protein